jgi:Protein of unknown function (DUF2442)
MSQRQDNEFVWNDEHPDVIVVRDAQLLDGFTIRLRFSNGEEREIDLTPYLHGPVFEPLRKNPELFRQMYIEGETIAWPNGADLAPETLYEDSHPIRVKREGKTGQRSRVRPRAKRNRPRVRT